MFRNLIRPDSDLMLTMSWVTDCIFFSLFWLLGCFLIIPFGGASAALYDATFRTFRKHERHGWIRFFRVFRANWKAGILPSILYVILFFSGAWLMIQVWNAAVYEQISWMFFSAAAIIGLLFFGMLNVMFPMMSRFENNASALLRNTVLLSLANLPHTLAIGFVSAIGLLLSVRYIFPMFLCPCLCALISSLFLEPMFKPYMTQELDAAE